ncbi:MAG TPA: FecR domain-containing protein [Pyrinomonadaceae bacterium]|nr:FecR domain-containing protein [Pyrinomonadaceae bacterium]
MKRNKKELEAILDQTVDAVRAEQPDTRAVDTAASRVWARIAADQNISSAATSPVAAAPASEHINNCGDFQTLIPSFLRHELSPARALLLEDHTQECIPCRKALKEARTGRTAAVRAQLNTPARSTGTNFTAWRWAVAASLAVAVAVGALFFSNRLPSGGALAATVESANGALYRVTDAGTLAMAVGEEIGKGVRVRTAKDSGAVVRLADGSRVEMRERSEFSITETAQGVTLNLDRGDVIVEAAKQGAGHLFVATPDSLVSVKGTIFAVGSGTKGSRVSVVEGEVHVNHSGTDKVLLPGDQTVTGASLTPVSVKDDIAWSRNASRYAKMVTELAALRKDIAQQVPHPGVRYSTRFLDLAPEGTVLYAALPNLATTLGESHRIMQERIAQNPALSQWMKEQESSTAHGPGLNQTMARVREFGQYLGDEIVVTAGTDAGGNPDAFLVLGELKNAQGFRPFLEKQIADLKSVDKGAPKVSIIDDPSAATTGTSTTTTATTPAAAAKTRGDRKVARKVINNNELFVWIREDFFAASPKLESLRGLQATMNAPGTNRFAGTPFYSRIADVYKEGAGLIVAADLERVIAQATSDAAKVGGQQQLELYRQTGLLNLKHFVVEQKEVKAKTQSRAVLSFNEPRRGIASWLAAPGPMGALKFVSPDANVATAFVVKEPTLLVDDLLGFMETASPDLRKRLRELETQNGLDLKRDFAAPLGGEFAFAIDGPVLPTPSWKMIMEVYDQKHLQGTFESVVGKLNAWAAQNGQKGLQLTASGGSPNIYTLRSVDFGLEVHYTFAEGYLIAAPTAALLTRALQYRESGVSLMTSARFTSALPEDGNTNFSAVFYHNLAPLLQPLAGAIGDRAKSLGEEQQKAIAAFAANSQPTLAYAYAQGDRITLAANTEGGPFGLSPGSLLGLPNSFAMQHILMEAMEGKGDKGNAPEKK